MCLYPILVQVSLRLEQRSRLSDRQNYVMNRQILLDSFHYRLLHKVQFCHDKPFPNHKNTVLHPGNLYTRDNLQIHPFDPFQTHTLPQDASLDKVTDFIRGYPGGQKESSKGMPEVQT